MTLRLIGLMSVVLFLSLGAFGLLLSLSEDDIMDEVTRTVSTVGTKTLAAVVKLSGVSESDAPNAPGVSGRQKQIVIRQTLRAGGASTDEEREIQEWLDSAAPPPGSEQGVFMIQIRTQSGGAPDSPGELSGMVGGSGSIWLSRSGVQAEIQQEQEHVRAHIPILRHVRGRLSKLGLEAQPGEVQPLMTIQDELVFQVPTRDYQSIFDKIRRRSLFLLMGVFMVGMVLSAGLARRFTRPIRELDQGLRLLSQGKLDVSVSTKGKQEIARLGEAFNDMTRRLRLTRDRERELTRKEKLSALGRLAAGVAHDVRNPLHSINLTLQHLQETCRPEQDEARGEFDRSMDLIRGEIRRLDGLVGNFLLFARGDREQRQTVRPIELVEETARLVAMEAERRGISVTVESSAADGSIQAHAESLRSALLNLVLNAFEALPEGGRVRLGCDVVTDDEGGRRVLIEVADNGRGIPEEDRERVFEFGYTTRQGGHGLGLAMVHQIVVEEHAGRVSLESAPGAGTRIQLEFPASPESPEAR